MTGANQFKCPECGVGTMTEKFISTYLTTLGGAPLVINNATISFCDHCGKQSVSAKELKRWRVIQRMEKL